jgi:chromosome partitioning protein
MSPSKTPTTINWQAILANLPNNANEALVCQNFVQPLLQALGFTQQEYVPIFSTGKGADKVDYAARKNNDGTLFIKTKINPDLLIEVKGREAPAGAKINLSTGSPAHKSAKAQITRYLLAPNCKTAQWGIITNADYIQLFRRHGKVVLPGTPNYLIKKK